VKIRSAITSFMFLQVQRTGIFVQLTCEMCVYDIQVTVCGINRGVLCRFAALRFLQLLHGRVKVTEQRSAEIRFLLQGH
jgi:hypothetical protein